MPFLVENDEAFDPVYVRLLGAQATMFDAENGADLVKRFRFARGRFSRQNQDGMSHIACWLCVFCCNHQIADLGETVSPFSTNFRRIRFRRLATRLVRTKHILTVFSLVLLFGAAFVAVISWFRQYVQHELSQAAFVGDLTTVRRCVQAGANLNEGPRTPDGGYGTPPLTIAALGGHTSVVRHLLHHGANPNLPGMSNPLIVACWKRHSAHVHITD